jgi:methylphosphotriester-DNA--protein-cysteine methyltransferase
MDLNKSALQTTGEVRHSEQDEKLWEAAAAKGHRPCPKCHKMVSLAPDHVFRSYAFIPDEEDVERAIKKRKQVQRKQRQAKKGAKKTTFMEIDDSDDEIEIQDAKKGASNGQLPTLDSDDEDMPDMFDLIAAANREKKPTVKDEKKEKKPKEEDNVDMSDVGVSRRSWSRYLTVWYE